MPPSARVACAACLLFLVALSPRSARAVPWVDATEGHLEDRLADGDLDEEDLAAYPNLGRARAGTSNLRGRSWISVVGFAGSLPGGTHEFGLLAVVGLAFDRIAGGSMHAVRDRSPPYAEPPATATSQAPTPPANALPSRESNEEPTPSFLLSPLLARATVAAAWRAAGLDASDARLDAIAARARASAALPETRLRAMRSFADSQHSNLVSDQGSYYETAGSTLWLEARLTWHLDRLLYADDEPTLERVRLERQEARSRVASHVLELLFQWQRARLDAETAVPRSRAFLEATLRLLETEASLSVATGGWFTSSRGDLTGALPEPAEAASTSHAPPPAPTSTQRPPATPSPQPAPVSPPGRTPVLPPPAPRASLRP